MKIKLVTDSSANIHPDTGLPVTRVPLKIVTSQKEYVDDASLNVLDMMRDLRAYRGTSGTACPGVGEWLEAFEDADVVFGVAITSNLSGCYGAANVAAQEYMAEHPGKKVFILDSLSTGPEMQLILEKYQDDKKQIWYEVSTESGRTSGFVRDYLLNISEIDESREAKTYGAE